MKDYIQVSLRRLRYGNDVVVGQEALQLLARPKTITGPERDAGCCLMSVLSRRNY